MHWFDLFLVNDRVLVGCIVNVKLQAGSFDVSVVVLSLMGMEYPRFLVGLICSFRKWKGVIFLAELASWFEYHEPALFDEAVKNSVLDTFLTVGLWRYK